MYVVCVSNHKGGVGKTTTAIGLATHLALRGHRVCAIGLDSQCNLAMGLGVNVAPGAPTAFDLLRGKIAPRQATQPVPHAGLELLRVIPAGKRLFRAEGWLYTQMGFEDLLKGRLAELAKTTDFAILDCSPSLGALTMNALRASDLVMVPVQCEAFSAQGVESLLELVTLMRRRSPDLRLHVLPTLYDKRNSICREVLTGLKRSFAQRMSDVVVGIDTKVRDSQARRTPLCIYEPTSRANKAYKLLAHEVEQLAVRRAPARAA